MFSNGQLIFALLFFITFVILIVYSYKKDKAVHNKFYKGNYIILFGFIIFIALLFVIKLYLKH